MLFTLIAALLVAKLAWNVSLPLWLARGRPLVLHARVEVILLVALLMVAPRPTFTAGLGVCAILASYALAYALGALLGWRYRPPHR